METAKAEIESVIARLNLSEAQFRQLSESEGRTVFNDAESRFVGSKGRQWWWEDFRAPATMVEFADSNGFRCLQRIIPSIDEPLWFIAETVGSDCFVVYEGKVEDIQAIIEECLAFEYYLLSKDFRWLVCENHHNVIFAIGAEVERHLREIEI